ncbi:VWA domain-containing protein [Mesorhizobium sp. YM1C-6-2]|uniref:vWA domain-containing protein n=1 Tax=Mesorhizobium sp. YM1C-6-2 TaxID=1827501 RepID=UPI000EF1F24F|nr:VWA domain-containing protein [Mesorhizobium sp. YM1C-6-2]RLP23188.1 VWA domain-containing protein [Mesorhizobium sp. YM1C-6-2]
MTALPPAARPFAGFARHLRRFGFPVAGEQAIAFMQGVTLLGPRSMEDIRQAALATLGPPHDRIAEFDALFRSFFYGETTVTVDAEGDEDTETKDDSGVEREGEQPELRQEESGESASVLEQLGCRTFRSDQETLNSFRKALPSALPQRRSLRSVRTNSRGSPDLRRALRAIVRADGDVPAPPFRRRSTVSRGLLILIDISGSMKLHTGDYLKLAHSAVQATDRVEVFTLGTRLTRITRALKLRDVDAALGRTAALVEDWDGGTRIGPTLLAFLSVPRFAAFARGAAVLLLSDGLERGDYAEMETAIRRLGARAFRLSLATPLAGDPRFSPETAALKAILPSLDDLVDGSSLADLADFMLTLARAAPSAETIWRRTL